MRVAALLIALSVTGCSWISVTPPGEPTECTESRTAPRFDVAMTAVSALTVIVVAGLCTQKSKGTAQDGSPSTPCGASEYVGLGSTAALGVAFGFSAHHGYGATRRCRANATRV